MIEKNGKVLDNVPYTVVGETSLPKPKNSILFQVGGLRKIIENMADEDLLRYESWEDFLNEETKNYYSRWTHISKDYESKN